ncbi:substrate-binding domain-containing protein [Actinoplanes sp. ATCC 53533]|uniref:substrate-binding domain-containing protein n=1 Tax=Actinoplanes sp. ATCC 53533 TaxID=1288362 RepID=UPI0013155B10|nr:substrate-binding domain-containing protein [Actinoplanes sp. ATCC 53533]
MTDEGLRGRPEFWPVTLLSIALVVVLGGWGVATYRDRTRTEAACLQRATLRVAAAPSIAPPAREIARELATRERCLTVVVEARESADVLRDLARTAVADPAAATTPSPGGTTASAAPRPASSRAQPASSRAQPASSQPLPSGSAAAPAALPDVWLPESTLWLRRARAAGAYQAPVEGVSVATTPVVLTLDGRSATRLGDTLGWPQLVADAKPPLPVVLPDPATSPIGFGALAGIRALARAAQPDTAEAGAAAIMRRLAPRTVSLAGEAPPAPTGPGAGEVAVVSTEQAVLFAAAAGRRQVAVYPPAAVPSPDYPYAVLATGPEREGATAFLRALLAAEGAAELTHQGLRTPRGGPPTGIPADSGILNRAYPPARLPAEPDTVALLNAWGGVHLSARLLAVFDISGSMAAQVPGTSDTRLSATIKAAQDGAKLLLGTTELGVWEFSTDLDGERDYREVVPVGPIGPRRPEIVAEVDRIRVNPNGGTGLYDTTLAAYRDATRNWTPGRINMVLILTDGTDDNASGISRGALLRELRGMADRKRPVPILFIGVGPDVDPTELKQIAQVTGGRVARTKQPSGIRQIFYTALAEFSCLPPKCRR